MRLLHSLRTKWRSEWQMPQKRMSICTSRSVGSRRGIVVKASDDVALPAEYAFSLYMTHLGNHGWLRFRSRLMLSRPSVICNGTKPLLHPSLRLVFLVS